MDSKGAVLKRNTSSKYILTETIGRDTLTFSILDSNKNELVKGSYLNDLKSGLFQFKINDKELNINYKKNKREGEFEYTLILGIRFLVTEESSFSLIPIGVVFLSRSIFLPTENDTVRVQ
jgi:hypothetical protein